MIIDGWMIGRVGGPTDRTDRWMDGYALTDRRTGGWMDGWMGRRTEECMAVYMDGQIDYCIIKLAVSLSIMCSLLGVSLNYASTKYLKT